MLSRLTAMGLATGIAFGVCMWSAARAQPPGPDPGAADRLHKSALQAANEGRWNLAIERWSAALKKYPHWKFAMNQGLAYRKLDRWLSAWHAMRQALRLLPPREQRPPIQRVLAEAETTLLKAHALVVVSVSPPNALVERDGVPWPHPREVWVAGGQSAILARAPGYDELVRQVEHPVGTRAVERLVLERSKAPVVTGRLRLLTLAKGVPITIDGLPALAPGPEGLELSPGQHTVRIELQGKVPYEAVVTVVAGQTEVHAPRLVAAPPLPRAGSGLTRWKWATFGVSLGALIAGGALFGHAGALVSEAETLQRDDPATYDAQRDELGAELRGAEVGAWTLIGVGAALAATSVVLFVLDREPATVAVPLPLPGGAGLSFLGRF